MDEFEIIPGEGIGKLRLGQYRNEVISLVGRPDEESEFSDEDDNDPDHLTLVWEYDSPAITLNFWQEDDFKVSLIIVDDGNLNIWGHHIDSYSEAALSAMIREAGFQCCREVNDEGRVYLDIEGLGLSFAVEDGVLAFASVFEALDDSVQLLE